MNTQYWKCEAHNTVLSYLKSGAKESCPRCIAERREAIMAREEKSDLKAWSGFVDQKRNEAAQRDKPRPQNTVEVGDLVWCGSQYSGCLVMVMDIPDEYSFVVSNLAASAANHVFPSSLRDQAPQAGCSFVARGGTAKYIRIRDMYGAVYCSESSKHKGGLHEYACHVSAIIMEQLGSEALFGSDTALVPSTSPGDYVWMEDCLCVVREVKQKHLAVSRLVADFLGVIPALGPTHYIPRNTAVIAAKGTEKHRSISACYIRFYRPEQRPEMSISEYCCFVSQKLLSVLGEENVFGDQSPAPESVFGDHTPLRVAIDYSTLEAVMAALVGETINSGDFVLFGDKLFGVTDVPTPNTDRFVLHSNYERAVTTNDRMQLVAKTGTPEYGALDRIYIEKTLIEHQRSKGLVYAPPSVSSLRVTAVTLKQWLSELEPSAHAPELKVGDVVWHGSEKNGKLFVVRAINDGGGHLLEWMGRSRFKIGETRRGKMILVARSCDQEKVQALYYTFDNMSPGELFEQLRKTGVKGIHKWCSNTCVSYMVRKKFEEGLRAK